MGLTYPANKICPRCGTGGYVWYLDNSEYVAKCTNCNHYFRREDFPMYVLDEAPKPITNYDRIISKTPEELAEWIFDRVKCQNCPMLPCVKHGEDGKGNCKELWLAWLREDGE